MLSPQRLIVRKTAKQVSINTEKSLKKGLSMPTRCVDIDTHSFSIVEAVVDGRIHELFEMSRSQSAVPATRCGSSTLDVLENGGGIRLRNK